MSLLLPDPALLGLPDKFVGWRPSQDRAVLALIDCDKRFAVPNAPTGFGKTVMYIVQAILTGKRTAILTSTKGLQTQLVQDFAECGLVDVRGQNNYPCKALKFGGEFRGQGLSGSENCDAGPCHAGALCSLRKGGCYYFDAVMAARSAKLVVTNYTYWIAQHRYSDGLGKFDLLVMDEAHNAPDELASSMEVELNDFDVETILGRHMPAGEDPLVWKRWAQEVCAVTQYRVASLDDQIKAARDSGDHPETALLREAHTLKSLLKRIQVIAQMEGVWVVEREPKRVRIAPVWAAPYAEKYLFLNIPRVVLVSATIKEKTLEYLGVKKEDFQFFEYPSTFPVSRRPVIYVPSVRCHHKWTDVEQRTWVNRIDQIIDRREDRKGVIHTTSYARRNLLFSLSRNRSIMHVHDGTNTRTVVEKFRRADPPAVLVSPSMTTGWDLPFEECEYAIIAKIPFPDTRSSITKARSEQDADYGPYVAMQTIVQASGRGMRSADDQCEVFIIDDQWTWFWRRHRKFAPRWFQAAVRSDLTLSDPLPKLNIGDSNHV
jgi:Rad3-related DNA helicase